MPALEVDKIRLGPGTPVVSGDAHRREARHVGFCHSRLGRERDWLDLKLVPPLCMTCALHRGVNIVPLILTDPNFQRHPQPSRAELPLTLQHSATHQTMADPKSEARRPSLLERMHLRKSSDAKPQKSSADDASSLDSRSQLLGKSDPELKKPKEHRERLSDSGPFKIVTDENGKTRCVENGDWPPGTHYKVPNRYNKTQGLSDFYTGKTIVDGGAG